MTRGLLALVILVALPGLAEARSPQMNYVLHCQGCHLADGSGMVGKVPAMKGEIAKFLAVPDGRAFLIQVPGVAKSRLNDAEVAEMMNWLLPALDPEHMPRDFAPFTADEVAALRADPENEVVARRAALEEAIGALDRED